MEPDSVMEFGFKLLVELECGPMPNVMPPPLPNIGDGLTPTARGSCSNAAKTRNPLKCAGVPQTTGLNSAVSGPMFAILRGHVEKVLLFNSFFRLSIRALIAKIQPNKFVRWCADGEFLASFLVLHFQRAACSTFQTCILNSH